MLRFLGGQMMWIGAPWNRVTGKVQADQGDTG